jgi:hypothetical protein
VAKASLTKVKFGKIKNLTNLQPKTNILPLFLEKIVIFSHFFSLKHFVDPGHLLGEHIIINVIKPL